MSQMGRLKNSNKKVFWVEKIALTDILRFLAQGCFDNIRINYDRFNTYPSAIKFLGFLERTQLNRIFFPEELTLRKLDEKGSALIYRVHKDLDTCIKEFFVKNIPQEPRRFKDTIKAYMAINLLDKVIFITIVDSEVNFGKASSGKNNIIYLNGHPLNYLVRRFYKSRGIVIKESVDLTGRLKYYLKPCFYCFLHVA